MKATILRISVTLAALAATALAGDAALTRALQEHVKTTVAPYKYPRAIEYVAGLPRTETGKLRRVELRRIAAETAAKLVTQGE